jgi:hypothetical protein
MTAMQEWHGDHNNIFWLRGLGRGLLRKTQPHASDKKHPAGNKSGITCSMELANFGFDAWAVEGDMCFPLYSSRCSFELYLAL